MPSCKFYKCPFKLTLQQKHHIASIDQYELHSLFLIPFPCKAVSISVILVSFLRSSYIFMTIRRIAGKCGAKIRKYKKSEAHGGNTRVDDPAKMYPLVVHLYSHPFP